MDTASTKIDLQGKKTHAAIKKPTVFSHEKTKRKKKEELK